MYWALFYENQILHFIYIYIYIEINYMFTSKHSGHIVVVGVHLGNQGYAMQGRNAEHAENELKCWTEKEGSLICCK